MNAKKILTVLCIIILFVLIWNWYVRSHLNTESIKACSKNSCGDFNVNKSHRNQKQAAEILAEITRRNKIFMEALKTKYIGVIEDPRISSNSLSARVQQLLINYNSDRIFEISPLNKSGVTSYTQDKKTLIYCLRKKNAINGDNQLHDVNTIMFVNLHELTHMMNDKWGHEESSGFWNLFKSMLEEAVLLGLYNPVNYANHPINYCGLLINYNPLFDENM